MITNLCPRCGMKVIGSKPHATTEECLAHLAPRYRLAQAALEQMHKRYRTLETRLERAKIGERLARKESKRNATVPARLAALEAALGIKQEQIHAA